jgi:ERCC4-related helicase
MLHEALSKMPDAFGSKILLRGQEYFLSGRVLSIRLSDGLLRGRVKGNTSLIYDIHMDLKSWPGVASRCSCPYQFNCKHAAACLLALRDRERGHLQSTDKLDRKLDIWLKNLRVQEEKINPVQEPTHHLTYLIALKRDGHEHKVAIRLALAKLLKRGGYGKKVIFNSVAESKKQHFIADDNDIVAQLLFKCGVTGWFDSLVIRNSELLERIIKTGRSFFASNDEDTPIQLGEQRTGSCRWVLASTGSQRLVLMNEDAVIDPVLIDECWYYDSFSSTLGRIDTVYPVKQLRHLLDAPPIPIDQAELLSAKMAMTCPEFPLPLVFQKKEIVEIQPIACVLFDAVHHADYDSSWLALNQSEETDILFVATVSFDYAGLRVTAEQLAAHMVRQEGETLIEYKRDTDFEASKIEEAHRVLALRSPSMWEQLHWTIKSESTYILDKIKVRADLSLLYTQSLPYLQEHGWQIEFASPLYQKIVRADEVEWYSEVEESTTDFFSYQLGILVDGKPVSIVPLIADLIQRYKADDLEQIPDTQQVTLPLTNGCALELEMRRIKPLVRLLLQFGLREINEQQQLYVNKYQFILMQEAELALAATAGRWRGGETLRHELKQLVQLVQLPQVEPPKGLHTQLRDYQLFGLSWLHFLRSCQFNGVLADDMGLGKTVQTLALLQAEKESGRLTKASLIIAPTSLVGNWQAEAKRFTPELRVLVYHGIERHQDRFEDYDLIISTYGLIQRDKEKFIETPFYYLILDEAQFIKNARTKTTQIIQQLNATHRLCLTGTPVENHLGELWSLFNFLMPGLLGDAKQFRLWFRTPIEKYADTEKRDWLAKRIKPFILRRTKNQVARELPPKTEMTRRIELVGAQRDLYEAIRMSMEKKVREAIAKQGLGKSHIVLLDALLKLRQVCCDPRLLSLEQATIAHGSSAKLEVLMELLDNLVEEGRRVLVFSQFTSMLKLIEEALHARNYDYLKLTGETQKRQALVERFQEGETPIFLISLKAGGTGLNLTKADTVIHYDPWWNPAVEDQATDRTHRIGQENPVFVYKLITEGTVEEAILSMQERKRQLVQGVLAADASQTVALTEADIEQFFTPLE